MQRWETSSYGSWTDRWIDRSHWPDIRARAASVLLLTLLSSIAVYGHQDVLLSLSKALMLFTVIAYGFTQIFRGKPQKLRAAHMCAAAMGLSVAAIALRLMRDLLRALGIE
jgi:hypothetical protein